MFDLLKTKYKEKNSKLFQSILNVFLNHFDGKTSYQIETTPEVNLKYKGYYIEFNLTSYPISGYLSERLKNFFNSQNWRDNIELIDSWLVKEYGENVDNIDVDLKDPKCFKELLYSNGFKNNLSDFSERVKFKFEYSDYTLLGQGDILIRYIFHHHLGLSHQEMSSGLSSHNFRVEVFQFSTGISDFHLPIHSTLCLIDVHRPSLNFLLKIIKLTDTSVIKALTG